MSDSKFAFNMEKDFRRQYPEEDGWKIRAMYPHATNISPSVQEMPGFLREKHPEWLKSFTTQIGGNFRLVQKDETGRRMPVPKWNVELRNIAWSGDLVVDMQGPRIIYRCFPLLNREGWGYAVLIAYTDEAALVRLHTKVAHWVHSKPQNRKVITVIGKHGFLSEITRPKVGWDDLILPPGLAEDIRGNVDAFFKSGPRYLELGLPHKRGFLLAGPPGNGKTMIAKAMAADESRSVIWLTLGSEIGDDEVDATFRHAAEHAPAILLLEDIDHLIRTTGVNMAHLLSKLDGLDSEDGILVLATTNTPEKLDPALLHRPSRFDRVWTIGLPTAAERLELLKRKGDAYFPMPAIKRAVEGSSGFSMAYTQEIVTNAVLIAANAGLDPAEEHLDLSLELLRTQFKATAAREGLNRHIKQTVEVGFSA